MSAANLGLWHRTEKRLRAEGETGAADDPNIEPCLRLITVAKYDVDEERFVAQTVDGRGEEDTESEPKPIPTRVTRAIGFLYLRTIRAGSRALSLESGTRLLPRCVNSATAGRTSRFMYSGMYTNLPSRPVSA